MHRRDLIRLAPATALAGAAAQFARPASAQAPADLRSLLPAAQRFRIGDIAVTAISDGYLPINHEPLIGIEKSDYDAILTENFLDPSSFNTAFNGFLVQTGDEVVLIDTGTGGAFGDTGGFFAENLAATGISPEQVTKVVATHLHPDHVGGSFTEQSAVFANAEFVVHEADLDFWVREADFGSASEMVQGFAQAAQTAVSAYDGRLAPFTGEAQVARGVTAMPLPGHTPGHAGFRIDGGDAQLLIWADIVHVAPVQLARPGVSIAFDVDPEEAAATRERVLDLTATDRLLVAGSHIAFPGFVHIARAGDGYRAERAPYDYTAMRG